MQHSSLTSFLKTFDYHIGVEFFFLKVVTALGLFRRPARLTKIITFCLLSNIPDYLWLILKLSLSIRSIGAVGIVSGFDGYNFTPFIVLLKKTFRALKVMIKIF